MKLLTFRPPRARTGHFGVLLSGNRILDVSALAGRKLPATLLECIQKGDSALAAVKAAAADAEAARERGFGIRGGSFDRCERGIPLLDAFEQGRGQLAAGE